jgi:hypothetical protein
VTIIIGQMPEKDYNSARCQLTTHFSLVLFFLNWIMNLECSLYGIIPDSKLDRLLQMLAGVTGSYASAFASHEIVLKPIDETPFGPSRNDDVILCLESNLTNGSECVGFDERKWSLVQKGHPEPPKAGQKLANHRLIFKSKIEGNCLDFVTLLGYEFSFEYISRGWKFRLNDVRILIFQVFQVISH